LKEQCLLAVLILIATGAVSEAGLTNSLPRITGNRTAASVVLLIQEAERAGIPIEEIDASCESYLVLRLIGGTSVSIQWLRMGTNTEQEVADLRSRLRTLKATLDHSKGKPLRSIGMAETDAEPTVGGDGKPAPQP
jgi:hypothetical protein